MDTDPRARAGKQTINLLLSESWAEVVVACDRDFSDCFYRQFCLHPAWHRLKQITVVPKTDPHSEHRFPAPSSKRKDVVNLCLEFETDHVLRLGFSAMVVTLRVYYNTLLLLVRVDEVPICMGIRNFEEHHFLLWLSFPLLCCDRELMLWDGM